MIAARLRWAWLPAWLLLLASCTSATVTVTASPSSVASRPGRPPTLPPFAVTQDEIQNIVLTTAEIPGIDPVTSGALADDAYVGEGSLRSMEFGWYSTFGTAPEIVYRSGLPHGPRAEGIADGITFATSAVAVLPLSAARRAAEQTVYQHEIEVDPELCDDYGYGQGSPPISACPYEHFFVQQDYALRIGMRDPVPCWNQTVAVRGGSWTWITCTWVLEDLRTYPQRGVMLTYSAGGGADFHPQSFVDLVESTSIVRALLASVQHA